MGTWSLPPAAGTQCCGVKVRITHRCTSTFSYSAAKPSIGRGNNQGSFFPEQRLLGEHHKGSKAVRQAFPISLVIPAMNALSPVLQVFSIAAGSRQDKLCSPQGLNKCKSDRQSLSVSLPRQGEGDSKNHLMRKNKFTKRVQLHGIKSTTKIQTQTQCQDVGRKKTTEQT